MIRSSHRSATEAEATELTEVVDPETRPAPPPVPGTERVATATRVPRTAGRSTAAIALAWLAVLALAWWAPPLAVLPLAALVGVAVVRCTKGDAGTFLLGFVVVLLLIPSRLAFAQIGGTATAAALVGIAAAWFWVHSRLLPSMGLAGGRQPLRPVIGFFVAAHLASWVAAYTRLLPGDESRAADRSLLIVAACAGIALFAADGLLTRDRLDAVLRRLVTCTAAVSLIGMVQFATGADPATWLRLPGLSAVASRFTFIGHRDGFRRVAGTAGHPIEFALILAVVLPLAFHYAAGPHESDRARRWSAVCLAVIAAGIPTTLSRSGVLGLVVALALLVPTWPRGRRVRVLSNLGVLLVATTIAYPGLLSTIWRLFSHATQDDSVTDRTALYGSVGHYLREAPLFGRGFGTFSPTRYFFVDNQYLMSIIETGIIGLLSVLALFWIGIKLTRQVRRTSADPATRSLAHSLCVAIVVAAVGFATFDALSFTMLTYLVFLLLGCIGALWRQEVGAHVG